MIICHITPTIMDGIVVRWNPDERYTHIWEISASRNGVLVHGWHLFSTEAGRDAFNATIAIAWDCYRALAEAADRGLSARMGVTDVRTWLKEHGVHLVEVRFGESLGAAMKREQTERADG